MGPRSRYRKMEPRGLGGQWGMGGGAVNSLPSWDLEHGAELTVGLCWGRWDPAWTGQEEAGVGLQRGHHHSKGSRCKEHQRQNRGPQSPLA